MLLAVDVGNTETVFGLYEGPELGERWRIATEAQRTGDELGSHRLANAVAARERFGAPVIVVDFGTSTNFDIVGPDGDFVGGVLAPGIETSMEALFSRAARLVKVDYAEPPHVIGKTTEQALRSGLVYGFAGQVDGIVEAIQRELGLEAKVVATGGLAELIAPHSRAVSEVEP